MEIANIEKKLINEEVVSDEELIFLLEYIVSSVREIVDDFTFQYKCDYVQGLISDYLRKINVKVYPCLTNHSINANVVGHSFTVAEFHNKRYIIDPSFIQFLYCDDDYEELFINNIRVRTKSPYYYGLVLDKSLIDDFIFNGYMELTEHNAFVFGNSFYRTMNSIPKDYSFSSIDGNTFIDKFLKENETLRFYDDKAIEVKSSKILKR